MGWSCRHIILLVAAIYIIASAKCRTIKIILKKLLFFFAYRWQLKKLTDAKSIKCEYQWIVNASTFFKKVPSFYHRKLTKGQCVYSSSTILWVVTMILKKRHACIHPIAHPINNGHNSINTVYRDKYKYFIQYVLFIKCFRFNFFHYLF